MPADAEEGEGEPRASPGHEAGAEGPAHRAAVKVTQSARWRAIPEDASAYGRAGYLLGGRYRLVDRVGAGAHGEVWAVEDEMLHEPAVLKWIHPSSSAALARVRREIVILRMLSMPGVVRFIDEGIEDGHPFIVMERIHGRPFPGIAMERSDVSRRFRWEEIAGVTLSLLEILSRVHAAGVVHRDLKPENVLVSADGRVTVLDFGISLLSEMMSDRLTGAWQILGTPRYLAPEQIHGAAVGASTTVDERTDLYAVGVMLYEALAGRAPHEVSGAVSLFDPCRLQPAPRIRELAPHVPRIVAEVVDRLVSTRIEVRFRSAAETIAALRGEAPVTRSEANLPWLGSDRPIEAIVQAVIEGRSIDVIGPPGSGRTRCLEEVARRLSERGFRVVWTSPARSPFGALESFIDLLPESPKLCLAAITACAEERVRLALRAGTVVLVDNVENTDAMSLRLLNRCRKDAGVVVRALPAVRAGTNSGAYVILEPLDERSLRPLFSGPDRLFHLQEDAARALWERTEGRPARLEAEVSLWVRFGIARWEGARLVIRRDALVRLGASLLGVLPAGAPPASLAVEPHLVELLWWLALGGHLVGVRQLAKAMGRPVWRIEAGCRELVRRGAARWDGRQRVGPRGRVPIPWNEMQRAAAHHAMARALRPGQQGRLFHLIAAELVLESVREAVTLGRQRAREGDHIAAAVALEEGLRVVRQQTGDGWLIQEARLLEELVKAAFAEETPPTMGKVLYEIARSRGRGVNVARLESLVSASMVVSNATSLDTLELLGRMAPFADPELERRRQRARLRAVSSRLSLSGLQAVLEDIEVWAEGGERLAKLTLLEGQGVLRYLQGCFHDAALLYAGAAKLEPGLSGRIATTLKSASALLEAFEHDAALASADEARAMARACRSPYWEARAEWLVRAALYRKGQSSEPDLELVDAVARVGVDDLEALVALTEAAVAFRSGALSTAVTLAERAAGIYRRLQRSGAENLARCLAIACGATVDALELDPLSKTAMECEIPGLGIQALGLLGRRFPKERRRWRMAPSRLWEGVPREHWGERIDVLSIEESRSWALRGYEGAAHSPRREPVRTSR